MFIVLLLMTLIYLLFLLYYKVSNCKLRSKIPGGVLWLEGLHTRTISGGKEFKRTVRYPYSKKVCLLLVLI